MPTRIFIYVHIRILQAHSCQVWVRWTWLLACLSLSLSFLRYYFFLLSIVTRSFLISKYMYMCTDINILIATKLEGYDEKSRSFKTALWSFLFLIIEVCSLLRLSLPKTSTYTYTYICVFDLFVGRNVWSILVIEHSSMAVDLFDIYVMGWLKRWFCVCIYIVVC